MKKLIRIIWISWIACICLFILFIYACNKGLFGRMPSIEEIQNPSASLASQVYANDGSLLGKYYLQDRLDVTYNNISPNVIRALISTEDERFYDHSGIDFRSMLRAILSFGKSGGASTITMQTAKNLFTEDWETHRISERLIQKIKEMIIAIKIERYLTKREILTLYLNTVSFGDNIYGIRNAAYTFFQKEPYELNIDEAATLIGMLKANTLYNPRRNPTLSRDRRNTVIDQMVKNNYLTAATAAIYKMPPINNSNYRKLDENNGLAPYFKSVLGEELKQWCKTHFKLNGKPYNLYKDGLRIYTTIDPVLQHYAEMAVMKQMGNMQALFDQQKNIRNGSIWIGHENVIETAIKQSDRWHNNSDNGMSDADNRKTFNIKTKMNVFAWNRNNSKDTTMTPYDSIKYMRQLLQTGFLVIDPHTGEVKAWVGGIDYKDFKYDHVNIKTKRQVGSTIKPLLYSLAVKELGFTPNTLLLDQQQSFGEYGFVPATTKSCSGDTMTMGNALAFSKNCATAYVLKALDQGGNMGFEKFIPFLQSCGISSSIPAYPSIALGTCDISLIEMVGSYSMFPSDGVHTKPIYLTRIEDRNGVTLATYSPEKKIILDPVSNYNMIEMMEGVCNVGTGRRIWRYNIEGAMAGKTGTTDENSDTWFLGYSPQLLGGAWVGCNDRFLRFTSNTIGQGSALALPIWAYFFSTASHDLNSNIDTHTNFTVPSNIKSNIHISYIIDTLNH